jgi:5'-nucleotidase
MRILLTNDDGIGAPGLRALIDGLTPHADLTVVAPQSERSATAHAITVFKPCLLAPQLPPAPGVTAYALDANPADCVKFALSTLLAGDPPALVISGINRGQNTGNNVIYSGTVAAATEAAMYGIPAIAISLAAKRTEEADFSVAAALARRLAPQVIALGLPPGVFLNVNVPNRPRAEIRGIVWTRQGHARFTDRFESLPEDNPPGLAPNGRRYLRNVGETMEVSDDDRNDDCALAKGHITVSPLCFDMTHMALYEDPPPLNLSLD